MRKGQALSPTTADVTSRIEDGVERLLRLASLQSDALSREVEVAARQKRLQEDGYTSRKEEPSTRRKKPISISIRSDTSNEGSQNMATWYFGLPVQQAAECGMKMGKKGKVIFTKTPPRSLGLPIDVPHPEDPRDPLSSQSNSPTYQEEKPRSTTASNASLPAICSLPFSYTSQTGNTPPRSDPRLQEDSFMGTFDFPMHIVQNGLSRVCTAKAVAHRQKGSPWLVLDVEVVDTDGSKLLNLKTELRRRETRNVVVNGDSYK